MRLRSALYRNYVVLRRRLLGLPAPGRTHWGDLRSVEPVGREFGTDRGRPIDRHYIEAFLGANAEDVRGRVLEAEDDAYARRFGGDRVMVRDVLHVKPGNPQATIVADLSDAPQIPDDTFDCIILTQVLHLVFDAGAALRTVHRILRPGGVLLLTGPGITPVPTQSVWGYTWHWAFTALSLERMLRESFPAGSVEVRSYGNVLAATAFLQGLAREELAPQELDAVDPDFPVILAARAQKAAA